LEIIVNGGRVTSHVHTVSKAGTTADSEEPTLATMATTLPFSRKKQRQDWPLALTNM
jgi:hypothetical protein